MKLWLPILGMLCSSLFAFQSESHVTARLIADRELIRAGETFHIGIHLKMADHWHTYWENPGFSGLPSGWALEPVPGLEVGPLQFPFPKKFTDDAGFVTYGYDDETLLFAEAKYSGEARKITLKGEINWLECKELCLPGKHKTELLLNFGDSKPANRELFQEYMSQSPVAFGPAAPFDLRTEYQFGKEEWRAEVVLLPKAGENWSKDAGDFEFFPLGNEHAELKQATLKLQEQGYVFRLRYEAWEETPFEALELSGVVRIQREAGPAYFRLPLHGQKTAASGASQDETATDVPGGSAAMTSGGGPAEFATESPAIARSFWFVLLLAFLGGMILNLMPCVLPVLSLKVFSLIQEAGESSMRRIKFGWVYTFGIMLSFLIISAFFVAAKLFGEQLGIGFQFKSPAFVIGMSVLIFIMGLNFFSVFEIGAPNSDKLLNLSQKGGYQGAFFQGALMTALSTPCTGLFIGFVYGWALTQPPLILVITFQMVAFGLAFPYVVLCYSPALLKFLPKPGPWMKQFKMAMGFLLLGTMVWLMDILGDLTGMAGVTGLATFLLLVGSACWVYGQTFYSSSRLKGLAISAGLLVFGFYLGLVVLFDIREPYKEKISQRQAFRLALMAEMGDVSADQVFLELEKIKTTPQEIGWVPYSATNLAYFRDQNRLIFLDFTASWCLTCKTNELLIIDTQKTRRLFVDQKVIVMRGDYTEQPPKMTAFFKSFERAGVPLYLVYPGKGEPILLPETITKSMIKNAIGEAAGLVARRSAL